MLCLLNAYVYPVRNAKDRWCSFKVGNEVGIVGISFDAKRLTVHADSSVIGSAKNSFGVKCKACNVISVVVNCVVSDGKIVS